MRTKNRRWLLLFLSIISSASGQDINSIQTNNDSVKDPRLIFSPRMDYDQWKPLGRGDPLKNDPTYDYVPPVLDRVHYWIDPALRKPDPPISPDGDNQKTEILLLGVSSKKPSTLTSSNLSADSRKDIYDGFLKFVDGPKFHNNNHQRIAHPHFTASYFASPFYIRKKNEQKVPYTMLMPPPPVIIKKVTTPSISLINSDSTTPPTISSTTSSSHVTIQPSDLIYQSSTSVDKINWTLDPLSFPTKTKPIVFQKFLQPPEPFIQIPFAPSFNLTKNNNNHHHPHQLIASNSDQTVNYVTPPPLLENEEIMHKGQVSDDDLGNTYVKIGKTEAQVDATDSEYADGPLIMFSHVKHPIMNEITPQTPLTLQTIQNMQTMQPPPITTSPIYQKESPTSNPILAILNKEIIETTTSDYFTSTMLVDDDNDDNGDGDGEGDIPLSTPATTTNSLTTDTLFKHYKQPMEPLKGPLYMIIQGHSKVKTYGPTKQIHGIPVQETNEIADDEYIRINHLLNFNDSDKKNNQLRKLSNRGGRHLGDGNLQTLKHVIQTGIGKLNTSDLQSEIIKRRDDNYKEAEIQLSYKVSDDEQVTSEKYHKGIVEEARQLNINLN